MDLEEIQSARSRERRTDSLQPLADSFYREAGEFVAELRAKRTEVAAEADDPFDSSEVRRLTNSIETAENTVEAIYERRVGKVLKLASLDAAGMSTDDGGLTPEERDLLGTLTDAIEHNRQQVIEGVAAGEDDEAGETVGGREDEHAASDPVPDADAGSEGGDALRTGTETETSGADRTPASDAPEPPTGEPTSDRATDPAREDVRAKGAAGAESRDGDGERDGNAAAIGAADAMGTPAGTASTEASTDLGGETADGESPGRVSAESTTPEAGAGIAAEPPGPADSSDPADASAPSTEAGTNTDGRLPAEAGEPAAEADRSSAPDSAEEASETTDRETIRVTRDVGEIVGIDERVYELASEDVVQLPAANAKPLIDRDAAERLE